MATFICVQCTPPASSSLFSTVAGSRSIINGVLIPNHGEKGVKTIFTRKPMFSRGSRKTLMVASCSKDEKDVVIVGAGIAGLATALSLHRLGIKCNVLEQADSLRTGGTSLTLFNNGWRALNVLGVADKLRNQFFEIQGMIIKTENGKQLKTFEFKDLGQEVRGVERRVLLETIANELPSDTIRFSSKLKSLSQADNGGTSVELEDGTRLCTKVLIGCDGTRSPVAKSLGFSDPSYVGHYAYRGLGMYPEGQPFEQKIHYIYGRGLRAGYVPLSPTKVYWFICYNKPFEGPRVDDPFLLKKGALELVEKWPKELLDVINHTPDNTVILTPLSDRWLWPFITPKAWRGGVVVAGDAWHPMTPNLGQGACCALEDSIVLSRNLAVALQTKNGGVLSKRALEEAFSAYENVRWRRVFPLTIRANFVGSLLQWENRVVCAIRNRFVIPKLVKLEPLLEHTKYDCGLLEV